MGHSRGNRQIGVVGRKALAEHEATPAAKSAESSGNSVLGCSTRLLSGKRDNGALSTRRGLQMECVAAYVCQNGERLAQAPALRRKRTNSDASAWPALYMA
jgi:hypothetical protein